MPTMSQFQHNSALSKTINSSKWQPLIHILGCRFNQYIWATQTILKVHNLQFLAFAMKLVCAKSAFIQFSTGKKKDKVVCYWKTLKTKRPAWILLVYLPGTLLHVLFPFFKMPTLVFELFSLWYPMGIIRITNNLFFEQVLCTPFRVESRHGSSEVWALPYTKNLAIETGNWSHFGQCAKSN